ncbi:MAG: DUF4185 domain-containing protein, partial [Steroidobacteraceae bacterium]
VVAVISNSTHPESVPQLAVDGDPSTYWFTVPEGSYLQLDLGGVHDVEEVQLSFEANEAEREYYFDLAYSLDGVVFTTYGGRQGYLSATAAPEKYPLVGSARYVRVIGRGNSVYGSTNLLEAKVFGRDINRPAGDGVVAGEPYARSAWVMKLDFSTHFRAAAGSDNFPTTWSDDGHQYVIWGDGAGFQGPGPGLKASFGVSRISGDKDSASYQDIYYGADARSQGTQLFDACQSRTSSDHCVIAGKSWGVLALNGVLYSFINPGSDPSAYNSQRLYYSQDKGQSWRHVDWDFPLASQLVNITFAQYGPEYSGSEPDGYVYMYAIQVTEPVLDDLKVQRAGNIMLLRAPQNALTDRNAYQFFAGMSGDQPQWTADLSRAQPAFHDPRGVGWNMSVTFNAGLGRYVLATEHDRSFNGNVGFFEAPRPWGPWRTILYQDSTGLANTAFFWNFSNKWTSADGREFVLFFTGIDEPARGPSGAPVYENGAVVIGNALDSYNRVDGRFELITSPP